MIKLIINYDKNKKMLSDIIKVLDKNNITFNEISTEESDLEEIFVKLIKKIDFDKASKIKFATCGINQNNAKQRTKMSCNLDQIPR